MRQQCAKPQEAPGLGLYHRAKQPAKNIPISRPGSLPSVALNEDLLGFISGTKDDDLSQQIPRKSRTSTQAGQQHVNPEQPDGGESSDTMNDDEWADRRALEASFC